jgi:hypothetical protein
MGRFGEKARVGRNAVAGLERKNRSLHREIPPASAEAKNSASMIHIGFPITESASVFGLFQRSAEQLEGVVHILEKGDLQSPLA